MTTAERLAKHTWWRWRRYVKWQSPHEVGRINRSTNVGVGAVPVLEDWPTQAVLEAWCRELAPTALMSSTPVWVERGTDA